MSQVNKEPSGQSKRRYRVPGWAVALCFPVGIITGGIVGAWFGSVMIGVVLGAAIAVCVAVALFSAMAVSAATRA